MSDKEKQIKILLGGRGRAYDYACQILGVDNMMYHSYAGVFTGSEAEFYEYILKNGLSESEEIHRRSANQAGGDGVVLRIVFTPMVRHRCIFL